MELEAYGRNEKKEETLSFKKLLQKKNDAGFENSDKEIKWSVTWLFIFKHFTSFKVKMLHLRGCWPVSFSKIMNELVHL